MTGRLKAAALIIAMMLLTAASVSSTYADEHCNFADETVLIGGVVPLSAPGSVAGGIGMQWGFQQAVADINADCGIQIGEANHRVKVVVADSEGVSEYGQAVVERLILQDKVLGIVGFYHSAVGLATMDLVQKYRIPTIYAHPRNDSISAAGVTDYEGTSARISEGIDYVFRTSPPSSIVGKVVTDWLVSQGVEKVIIILENTDYGHPGGGGGTRASGSGGCAGGPVGNRIGNRRLCADSEPDLRAARFAGCHSHPGQRRDLV